MKKNCLPRGYTIHFQNGEEPEFSTVPRAELDTFPWGCSYRPSTHAHVLALPQAFAVRMVTDDQDVKAEVRELNGPVYTDNCMEFFLMPDPVHSKEYINFEFNGLGTLFISIGTNRFDRRNLEIENHKDLFQVKTEVYASQENENGEMSTQRGWSLEYQIPYAFIREYFPKFQLRDGLSMRANFFKCGEECSNIHYGCWSPIDLPAPDFHSPDYFGILTVEMEN